MGLESKGSSKRLWLANPEQAASKRRASLKPLEANEDCMECAARFQTSGRRHVLCPFAMMISSQRTSGVLPEPVVDYILR
jgi:hypothetical protein